MSLESALPEMLPPQPPGRMQSADLDQLQQLGRSKAAAGAPDRADLLQRAESADLPAGVRLKASASWDLRGHDPNPSSIKARYVCRRHGSGLRHGGPWSYPDGPGSRAAAQPDSR